MNFLSLLKRNFIYKIKSKKNIDHDTFEKDVTLDNLFEFYKTDKASNINSNDQLGHGYSSFYHKHFNELQSKKINLLEIGSYSGASAAAFSKYFKNINIYCLDINLSKIKYESKNIFPFGINANDKKSVKRFFKKIDFYNSIIEFDIIIDDGSHILSDQLKSLNFFFNFVKKGGYYVIEEYRFPEYFPHLKDTNEVVIKELIYKIRKKENIQSKIFDKTTFESLSKNIENIFEYKGNSDHSDILFIKKNN